MRSRANIASHPIHPMLVALPIGLWIGAFVFSLISAFAHNGALAAAAFYATVAGCVGAVLAGIVDTAGERANLIFNGFYRAARHRIGDRNANFRQLAPERRDGSFNPVGPLQRFDLAGDIQQVAFET